MSSMKVLAGLLVLVVFGAGGGAGAQVAPAFSGDWVLVSARPVRPGYEQFWLGTEAKVVQTAEGVEIVRVVPEPPRTAKFLFDGNENQNVYTVDGKKIIRDSRATLTKGLLLISTDTTTEDGRRWLSNILRWSLDSDGGLLINDTEICGNGECPSIITNLTFKRK